MLQSPILELEEARKVLRSGGVLVYPTETFYAIGCRSDSAPSISLIQEIKRRPDDKPFPLIIGDDDQAALAADISFLPRETMEMLWPGPLTILLPALKRLDQRLKNVQNKVALRLPSSTIARDLAIACGVPIVATSANFADESPSPTFSSLDPAFLKRLYELGGAVLRDDGEGKYREPSSLIEFADPKNKAARILREGALTRDELDSMGVKIIN